MMIERLNITDKIFGRLRVVKRSGSSPSGDIRWLCICECGNTKEIDASSLISGATKSCGCFNREQLSLNKTTHGQASTEEYRIWNLMIQRCHNINNTSFINYGARGISVCERWRKFENFFADMGLRPSKFHSIDRFPNNNGNYEPSNCRWATAKEQNRNSRHNRWLEYNGIKMILEDWAAQWGVTAGSIIGHFKRGKDFAAIFNHYELKSR